MVKLYPRVWPMCQCGLKNWYAMGSRKALDDVGCTGAKGGKGFATPAEPNGSARLTPVNDTEGLNGAFCTKLL